MKVVVEEAGVIYDPNVVEWVELHVESSDLHDVWTLALTLYFEGEPQVDIAQSLGVAQPYISRRAKQFLKWIKDKDS
jgi:transposase-like protein